MKKSIIQISLITIILCISLILFLNTSITETRNVSAIELNLETYDMSWTHVSGTNPSMPTTSSEFSPLRSKFLGVKEENITYPNIPKKDQSWTYINEDGSNSPSTDNEFMSLRSKVLGVNKKEIKYPSIPKNQQSWTYINSIVSSSPSTREEFASLRKQFKVTKTVQDK